MEPVNIPTAGNWHGVIAPAVYHKQPGISASMLKACDPPAKLFHQLQNPRKPTDAVTFGTTVHELVFGCESISALVRPDGMDFRTKEGKAWKQAAEMSGRETITADDARSAALCCEAVWRNSAARMILESNWKTDFGLFCDDPALGVRCRALLDCLPESADFIADLKTTRAGGASKREFTRDAIKFGYHLQAAWYLRLYNALFPNDPRTKFVFIVVETEAPFLTAVYEMAPDFIEAGERECIRRAKTIFDCEATGIWPGLPEFGTLEKPAWLGRDIGFEFWE